MQRSRSINHEPKVFPVQYDGIISNVSGASISFSDVIKKYNVTPEQLKEDMRNLRWRQIGKEYFFDLKQIKARYEADSDKLNALAKLEYCEAQL